MNNYFQYNNGKDIIPSEAIRISPSQLSKFFDSTSMWYRSTMLGEQEVIENRTPIELGTCIHALAAMYLDNAVDRTAVYTYIDSLGASIDKQLIRDQIKPMSECLINQFLSIHKGVHKETHEQFISYEVLPGIYAAGTYDLLVGDRLYDYKTIGSLDTVRIPTTFPRNYWFQQLAYAYILTKLGHNIKSINLVYITRSNIGRISETTGKPLKDYPSECHIVSMEVTNELLDMMHGILNVVAHSVQHWNEHPEYRYLLAQDFRLYTKPPAKLFK